ncbi:MAG: DinB family protein [Armatimonadetes bacterium]|nr:DinB family protein [Armatimonadota bacterium]MDE2205848.1 DinB family protein [Armatimonadota bacterium]
MDIFVAICKERATAAMEGFLHGLSFVPADKLNWSPTPTAKSAMQVAAHCAGYSGAFAWIIREGKFPCTVEEFRGRVQASIESVTTLEEAEAMLRQGIAETLAALDTVKPEQVGAMVDSPQGQTPFKFFLTVPARHLEAHDGQIDYLQTCWGDLEVHL